jgi:hypothetical protein
MVVTESYLIDTVRDEIVPSEAKPASDHADLTFEKKLSGCGASPMPTPNEPGGSYAQQAAPAP